MDLSKSAFQKLAPLDVGVVNGITWKFVSTSGGGNDTQGPSAPSGLYSPSRTSSSVSLAWNASSDNIGVTGYDVYRGTTKVSTVTGTTATVSGLSPSTSYAFTVKAHDAGSGGGGTLPHGVDLHPVVRAR
ncbi:fibronectin type III domain-containing protein [Streptomyces luteolifulvus]|uniref:Fibronectin type III domain-containing protein n=1 Tax=Streptomyces luteolifulvus TaxID=2615112 RepID=A0A6H9URF1_9ACTN|nr:fibronectin type III domain-containing protein [Streptomyces luteolifulvus]